MFCDKSILVDASAKFMIRNVFQDCSPKKVINCCI